MNALFPNDDRDLQERFAALRRHDAAHTPDFAATLRKQPGGRRGSWLKPALAAALLLIALSAARKYWKPEVTVTASITEWKSPTDFLLETSGHELLEGVPKIGEGSFGEGAFGEGPLGGWQPGEWPAPSAVPSATPTPSGKKQS